MIDAVDLGWDDSREVFQEYRIIFFLLQMIGKGFDRGDRIFDLMRHAAGQRRHRFHLFRLSYFSTEKFVLLGNLGMRAFEEILVEEVLDFIFEGDEKYRD